MDVVEDEAPIRAQSTIAQFTIKVVIVAFVCVYAVLAVATYVDDLVQYRVEQIRQAVTLSSPKIRGREFWFQIEKVLEEQADPKNDMSPEKKAKLLKELRVLSDRWRLFIEAIILPNSDSSTAPKP